MQTPKFLALIPTLTLCFCLIGNTAQVAPRPDDPCLGRGSNAEEGRCYANEQAHVNAEADALVSRIASDYLKTAKDPESRGVNASLYHRSAGRLLRSQQMWRAYRDRYCEAIQYGWGAGSGAGGAYQTCMFELGKARVEQLQSDFPEPTSHDR